MRYRVKKDFVLEGTLLAWGDSLYLQQAQEKEQWEVFSLFTRKLVGTIKKEIVDEHLNEDENSPKEKFKKGTNFYKDKSIRNIPLILLMFFLPLWGNAQQGINPVNWSTKLVQTGENIFELQISASIKTNYFIYPFNQRRKCEFCPVLILQPNLCWDTISGPEIYYYSNFLPKIRGTNPPDPYCPIIKYTDSVMFLQLIRRTSRHSSEVSGSIEYYPTHLDSVGQSKTFEFNHKLL